jgi:beta-fructofuranosidase
MIQKDQSLSKEELTISMRRINLKANMEMTHQAWGIARVCVITMVLLLVQSNQIFAQQKETINASAVPRYTFPETLEAQLQGLQSNPLMLRFAESRENFAEDPYRPHYHFVSPESRLNDPNGLCYWQGNWHLFYQGYPPEDPRQHWGHAVSVDLIHWKDLPYAIYPGPERACYSDATLVEEDRVIAMYHGTQVGNMVAVSDDPLLLNWDKLTGNAVIPLDNPSGFPLPYTVYDPNIWKKDSVYYSLSGGRTPEGPEGQPIAAAYLFRSTDLVHWQYQHSFVEGDRFTMIGDDYACPYFWPIGDRYILPYYSHMSGGQYLLGDYDKARDKFMVTQHGNFNFGPSKPSGVHAPSACPDGDDVIIIFNMNSGYPTEGWDQLMSLPRRLFQVQEDQIGMEPAGDLASLRYGHQQIGPMDLPANKEIVLKKIKGNVMELAMEIEHNGAPMIEVNVLRSPKREEYTRIALYPARGYGGGRQYYKERAVGGTRVRVPDQGVVSLETAYASVLPGARSRAPETAMFPMEKGERFNLRIFIDRSVVEVFVNDRQCVAARVYPGLDESVGVSMRSQGKDSRLVSLDAWQMANIWDQDKKE